MLHRMLGLYLAVICVTVNFIHTDDGVIEPSQFYQNTWEEAFSNVWVLSGNNMKRQRYLEQIVAQASISKDKKKKPTVEALTCKMESEQQSPLISTTKLDELLTAEREKLNNRSRIELEKVNKQRLEKYVKLVDVRWTPTLDNIKADLKGNLLWGALIGGNKQASGLYLLKMFELARYEQRQKLIDQRYPGKLGSSPDLFATPQSCSLYTHTWEEEFSNVWALSGSKMKRAVYLENIVKQVPGSGKQKCTVQSPISPVGDANNPHGTRLGELLAAEREKLKALSRTELEKNDKKQVQRFENRCSSSWGNQWQNVRMTVAIGFKEKVCHSIGTMAANGNPNNSGSYQWGKLKEASGHYLLTRHELARSQQRKKLIDQIHPLELVEYTVQATCLSTGPLSN